MYDVDELMLNECRRRWLEEVVHAVYVDCNDEIEIQQIVGHSFHANWNEPNQMMIDIICILYIYWN